MKTKTKDKAKSSKTSTKDAARERMRRKQEEFNRKQSGGDGGGDDRFMKLEQGKNYVRFLPAVDADAEFYKEYRVHFRVGPEEKTVRCISKPESFDKRGNPSGSTKCPICKTFVSELAKVNAKHKKGSPKGKELWRKLVDQFRAKVQYLANVVDVKGDKSSPKLLRFGEQILSQLLTLYLDEEDGTGDFTDPESGTTLIIEKTGEGRETEYTVRPVKSGPSALDNWSELEDARHDLDESAGELLDVESIKAILDGVDYESDDEDEDSDDEDSEDEDEDSESDDDSEDEDEDEEPPPKKTKKLKSKR